jgi:hypothetical protein
LDLRSCCAFLAFSASSACFSALILVSLASFSALILASFASLASFCACILASLASFSALILASLASFSAEKEAKEAKAKSIREANEAKIRVEKQAQEAKKAKKAQYERKSNPAKIDAEIFQGNIRLVLPITVPAETANRFGRYMEKIEGVKILMHSHSEEGGHQLLLTIVKPIALMRLIKDLPLVQNVDKKGGAVLVNLRDELIF